MDVTVNQNCIVTNGFVDVNLALRKIAAQIRREDPMFFAALEEMRYASMEADENFNPNIEDLVRTPLSAQYLLLQGLRTEGMQHTIEALFKILKHEEIVTPQEFADLIKHTWLFASKSRAESEERPLSANEDIQFVPFSFR